MRDDKYTLLSIKRRGYYIYYEQIIANRIGNIIAKKTVNE
jgi:hypothetical protein